jgi:hypothetical protein
MIDLKTSNPLRKVLKDLNIDADAIGEYLDEQIEESRAIDKLSKESGAMGNAEYFRRECRYSQVERFIIKLKLKQ